MEITGLLERIVEERHAYLIVDLPQWHRYVQFVTTDGEWVRGETVGNEYLEFEASLTEDDDRLLLQLGWNPVEPREEACGNYWRHWNADELQAAGALAALTLVQVHGLRLPNQAVVKTGRAATWRSPPQDDG
jgi:hypothetical protein